MTPDAITNTALKKAATCLLNFIGPHAERESCVGAFDHTHGLCRELSPKHPNAPLLNRFIVPESFPQSQVGIHYI